MSEQTLTKYNCDNCGRNLKSFKNELNIITSKSEGNTYWERLHVRIERTYGAHNDAKTEQAMLCKKCAIKLLTDAISRVKKGERATAGAESSDIEKWL